ncbi:hypothetical protein D9M68_899100 [compost metagenome]
MLLWPVHSRTFFKNTLSLIRAASNSSLLLNLWRSTRRVNRLVMNACRNMWAHACSAIPADALIIDIMDVMVSTAIGRPVVSEMNR